MKRHEVVVSSYGTLSLDTVKAREPAARDLIVRAIKLTQVCDGLAAALDDTNALGRETVAAWADVMVTALHAHHHSLDQLQDKC